MSDGENKKDTEYQAWVVGDANNLIEATPIRYQLQRALTVGLYWSPLDESTQANTVFPL